MQHTFVLHRLHFPYLRPPVAPELVSTKIWFGLIHSPQPLAGQYIRFFVVYSWYLRFHFILNFTSKSFSTCLRGIWSDVQHFGGICCGSVTDMMKIRFKHAWHIRCEHRSFADLLTGISSDRQARHVILACKSANVYYQGCLSSMPLFRLSMVWDSKNKRKKTSRFTAPFVWRSDPLNFIFRRFLRNCCWRSGDMTPALTTVLRRIEDGQPLILRSMSVTM